jgi:8-oxo-dGTP pyrophosphatase MutT (NUDIX family)
MVCGVPAEVPIRPAATVVVLRDTPRGPEVFLVRRHHAVAFMAGAHVFPGGRVDAADADADPAWCDPPAGGVTAPGPAWFVAALRELFEEAGVLLARTLALTFVSFTNAGDRARFERYRHDVHQGTRTFRDVIAAERLRLALDAIVPFARWLTPPDEVRRFDTWFFLACVPDGQQAAHDTTESTDSVWLAPADALAQARRGVITLPPPTWATLRELEPFTSAAAALDWARSRIIVERRPQLVEEDGRRVILLTGTEPSAEAVPFETRFVFENDRWLPDGGDRRFRR